MDYKARFYSPALGRFLQPDTIIPDQFNPQSWNKYSYTFNNPIKYNDPSGHCPMCIGLIAGAIVGAATYAITTAVSGREFSASDLALATAVGAAGGFLIGTGVGAATGVAAFAAIGAGTGALSAQIGYSVSSGKKYDSGEMVIASSVGAVAGAAKGALSVINPGGTSAVNTAIDGISGGLQYGLTQMYNGRQFSKALAAESISTGFISAGVSGIIDDVLGGPSTYQNYSSWLNMSSKNTFLSPATVKYLARAAATSESLKGISVSAVSETANNYVQKKLLRVE